MSAEWQRIVTVAIGPVDYDPLGTFGWFVGVRCCNRPDHEARERSLYGTCVICRRLLDDDEQIHMVFSVVRCGKPVGNRLCCSGCAETHGSIHTWTKGSDCAEETP